MNYERVVQHLTNYEKERAGLDFVFDESGFMSFRVEPDHVFISDIYIDPAFRGSKKSHKLALIAESIARKNGFNYVSCQADNDANGFDRSVSNILDFGFEYTMDDGKLYTFRKEVIYG